MVLLDEEPAKKVEEVDYVIWQREREKGGGGANDWCNKSFFKPISSCNTWKMITSDALLPQNKNKTSTSVQTGASIK